MAIVEEAWLAVSKEMDLPTTAAPMNSPTPRSTPTSLTNGGRSSVSGKGRQRTQLQFGTKGEGGEGGE